MSLHELEVDVRVVDRRVAAERVVRDVQRVVRARGDRQPGLVRRVEHGRRDLADAAAEAGLELAVDDHGRLEEALRGRPLAGRVVERERRARGDQLAVDQVRDELDVVDPVLDPAVDRLVRADDAGDPHRLRGGGRALRLRDRELSRAALGAARSAAASTAALATGTSSARPVRAGTTRTESPLTANDAPFGARPIARPRPPKNVSAGRPPNTGFASASCWSTSIDASCQRVRRRFSRPTVTVTGAETMRRSRSAASFRSSALTLRLLGDDRQRDGPALEARERVDDDAAAASWSSTVPLSPSATTIRRPRRWILASRGGRSIAAPSTPTS